MPGVPVCQYICKHCCDWHVLLGCSMGEAAAMQSALAPQQITPQSQQQRQRHPFTKHADNWNNWLSNVHNNNNKYSQPAKCQPSLFSINNYCSKRLSAKKIGDWKIVNPFSQQYFLSPIHYSLSHFWHSTQINFLLNSFSTAWIYGYALHKKLIRSIYCCFSPTSFLFLFF